MNTKSEDTPSKDRCRKIINVIIPARNEENHIIKTLESLDYQTCPPKFVAIVDDGSSDNTVQLIKNFKPKTFTISLIERKDRIGGKSLIDSPLLAVTINMAFREACKYKYDFILAVGADTQFESEYIEKMNKKFEENPRLAVASGMNPKYPINPDHAQGSGRYYPYRFWKWYGEQFPISYGFESQCLMECRRLGLVVKSFPDVHFDFSRVPEGTVDFFHWGKMMRALGYNPVIVVMRAVRFSILQNYGVRAGIRFIAGYLTSGSLDNLSTRQQTTRNFVFHYQLGDLIRKVVSIFPILRIK